MTRLPPPEVPDLDAVEARFQESFRAGRAVGLDVLGYGEITSVVAWPTAGGSRVACRRLPEFPTEQARTAYREAFDEYLGELHERGIPLLPMTFHEYDGHAGRPVAYLLQAAMPVEKNASAVLHQMGEQAGRRLMEQVFGYSAQVVTEPWLGFDAQLSNWSVSGEELLYLDVTPPFLRDRNTGLSKVDTGIFAASLPWFLRGPVQRWLAPSIMAEYFDLRILLINFLANLIKEDAERWIPAGIEIANKFVSPAVEPREVASYYRKDAVMWEVLQRLRRADRWWQLRIRRRSYPVLLPGRISRRQLLKARLRGETPPK